MGRVALSGRRGNSGRVGVLMESLDGRRMFSGGLGSVYLDSGSVLVPGRETIAWAWVGRGGEGGTGETQGAVTVHFSVSRNNVAGDADDVVVGLVTGEPLGEVGFVRGYVRLPDSLSSGEYYLVARTGDGRVGISETARTVMGVDELPDYVPVGLESPTSLLWWRDGFFAGNRFNSIWRYRNVGGLAGLAENTSEPFDLQNKVSGRWVITADDIVGNEDDRVLSNTRASGLSSAPEAYILGDVRNLPVDLAAGSYRLALVIDPENQVAESDETNNVSLTERFEISAPTADVRPTEIRLGVGSGAVLAAGQAYGVSTTVDWSTYAGRYEAIQNIYLSKDDRLSDDDVLVGYQYSYTPEIQKTLSIREGTVSGEYYLILAVNEKPNDRDLAETDYSNNTLTLGVRVEGVTPVVEPPPVDEPPPGGGTTTAGSLTSVSFLPETVAVAGREVGVFAGVGYSAGDEGVRVWFLASTNNVAGDGDDIFLGVVMGRPDGYEGNVTGRVNLPEWMSAGDYYLVARTGNGRVGVSNETVKVTAANQLPDFVPNAMQSLTSLLWWRDGFFPGNRGNFSFEYRNAGGLAGLVGNGANPLGVNNKVFGRLVVSGDDVIGNEDDRVLSDTSAYVDSTAPRGVILSDVWNLPTDLPIGSYRIALIIDPENRFAESDETNNISLSERFELRAPTADIRPTSIVLPGGNGNSLQAGASYPVSASIDWSDYVNRNETIQKFYLSTDNLLSADDTLVGFQYSYSTNEEKKITIPAGTYTGEYYVIVGVNTGALQRELVETDYSNNALALRVRVEGVTPPAGVGAGGAGSGNGGSTNDGGGIEYSLMIPELHARTAAGVAAGARVRQELGLGETAPGMMGREKTARYRVLLSADDTPDASDRVVGRVRIEAGASETQVKFRVPGRVATGTYRYFLVPEGKRVESPQTMAPTERLEVVAAKRDANVQVGSVRETARGLMVSVRVRNEGSVDLRGPMSLKLRGGEGSAAELQRALSSKRVSLDLAPGEMKTMEVLVRRTPAGVRFVNATVRVTGDDEVRNDSFTFDQRNPPNWITVGTLI